MWKIHTRCNGIANNFLPVIHKSWKSSITSVIIGALSNTKGDANHPNVHAHSWQDFPAKWGMM